MHRTHRIISSSIGEEKLVGDVHALSFIVSLPRYRSTMGQRLREIIGGSLCLLDAPVAATLSNHTRAVVNHTLGRQFHYVKGRGLNDTVSDANLNEVAQQRISNLLLFMNGNIATDRVEHYCNGCCRSRDDTIENVASAFEAAVLAQMSNELPSKNRWGSCAHHLGIQVCGHLMHNLLHKVLVATFPHWSSPDEVGAAADGGGGDNGDDDFRKQCRNKAWRSIKSTRTVTQRRGFTKVSWISEPLDHL